LPGASTNREEIQEPDREKGEKLEKSNSNYVLGFLKDFVGAKKMKKKQSAEKKCITKKCPPRTN
jgi:hypothetical protein